MEGVNFVEKYECTLSKTMHCAHVAGDYFSLFHSVYQRLDEVTTCKNADMPRNISSHLNHQLGHDENRLA